MPCFFTKSMHVGFLGVDVKWSRICLTNRQHPFRIFLSLLEQFLTFEKGPVQRHLFLDVFTSYLCHVIKNSRYLIFANNIKFFMLVNHLMTVLWYNPTLNLYRFGTLQNSWNSQIIKGELSPFSYRTNESFLNRFDCIQEQGVIIIRNSLFRQIYYLSFHSFLFSLAA